MLKPKSDAWLTSSDSVCVTFKSCEGKSVLINKYFLFLFDPYYWSIQEELVEESPVFIFEGVSFEELILLEKQIHQKHLLCSDPTALFDDDENNVNDNDQKTQQHSRTDYPQTIESDSIETYKNQTQEQAHLMKGIESESQIEAEVDPDTSEKKSSDDILTIECPFKCPEVPDSKWTVETLFAHIFSKHISDVKNNFYVSIDTFIDRLSSRLSSTNCAFKCEKSRHVYDDIIALKNHYHRCHVEDPVICPHCGESLMNSLIYVAHINRSCNVRVRRKCDLCDGKTIKNLTSHMKTVHGEKKVVCNVDGCSLKFVSQFDLTKHTRAVHKKEKPFVCDKCGTKMAQFANLKDHRIKVHRQGNMTFKEYKEMIKAGQHQYISKGTEIPKYL